MVLTSQMSGLEALKWAGAGIALSRLLGARRWPDEEQLPSMDALLGRHVDLASVRKIGEGTFGEAFAGGERSLSNPAQCLHLCRRISVTHVPHAYPMSAACQRSMTDAEGAEPGWMLISRRGHGVQDRAHGGSAAGERGAAEERGGDPGGGGHRAHAVAAAPGPW